MDKFIVAVVQQRMRLPDDLSDFEKDLRRFLHVAQARKAQLVVFPELSGLMAAPPLLNSLRARLLRQVDRARGAHSSLWAKAAGKVSSGAANFFGTNFTEEVSQLLQKDGLALWDGYEELFSRLAREMNMTIVAGSTYAVDSVDGAIRNIATVFGPRGTMLGQQSRVVVAAENSSISEPGDGWGTISTPVGRIGLLLGPDVLFPEAARILAFQGAEFLIGLGACSDRSLYHRMRAAMLARAQENHVYGAMSFLVGHNPFTPGDLLPFMGRSSIYAPIELTRRYSGVMAEIGAESVEGVISAEWSIKTLRDLWDTGLVSVRYTIPMQAAAPILTNIFQRNSAEIPSPTDDFMPIVEEELNFPEAASTKDNHLMTESQLNDRNLEGELNTKEPFSRLELPAVPKRRWPWQR